MDTVVSSETLIEVDNLYKTASEIINSILNNREAIVVTAYSLFMGIDPHDLAPYIKKVKSFLNPDYNSLDKTILGCLAHYKTHNTLISKLNSPKEI